MHLASRNTVVGKQFCQREISQPWLAAAAAATYARGYFKPHICCRNESAIQNGDDKSPYWSP